MIDCDHAYTRLPITVDGMTVVDSHGDPIGRLRIDRARQRHRDRRLRFGPLPATARRNASPASSSTGIEEYSSTAFTALGVRPELACSTRATTPLVTPAAMLVPDSRM